MFSSTFCICKKCKTFGFILFLIIIFCYVLNFWHLFSSILWVKYSVSAGSVVYVSCILVLQGQMWLQDLPAVNHVC